MTTFYRKGDGPKPGPYIAITGVARAKGAMGFSVPGLPPQVPLAFYVRQGSSELGWGPISPASKVVQSSNGEVPARPSDLAIAPPERGTLDCDSLKLTWSPNHGCAISAYRHRPDMALIWQPTVTW